MSADPLTTLLVVLAHPDDESFPIGGTIAKYAAAGVRVILVCATRGEAGVPDMASREAGLLRQRELEAAAAVLGIAQVRWLPYMDGTLANANTDEVVAHLEEIMRGTQPQAIITFGPDGISGHPDHVAISRYTTSAFDRVLPVGRLYYVAPSEATEQGCRVPSRAARVSGPMAAIDIDAFRVTKVRAMQSHVSQRPPYPGEPEVEAGRLFCHEYFSVARPRGRSESLTDLFADGAAQASELAGKGESILTRHVDLAIIHA